MVLRLDSRFPVVWRTPSSMQVGVDPPIVIVETLTEAQERMLSALVVGVSEPGLTMLARGHDAERTALLAVLAPALEVPRAESVTPEVAISGPDGLVAPIAHVLAGSGVRVLVAAEVGDLRDARPHLAIAAGHFVLEPQLHAFWLRRDVPHLPVVLGDTSVTVGPMIEPGAGPCLLCLELHRRDGDAAWPALAAQLLGRRSHAGSAVLVTEAAGIASRAVLARLADGPGPAHSVRVDAATGERDERRWAVHPECGCAGLDALSSGRRETGWAGGRRHATASRSRPS
jgi:bacteriocin biosynthesis cyclodehydratase domain-containing protein